MQAHYIFHSGFLLETETCYYLFDYYRGALPPLDPKKPIVVCASHAHRDHYQPEIFSILQRMGMDRILAVLAKDIPENRYPKETEVLKVFGEKAYPLPNGDLLETLLSTDSGVAFLLTTAEGVAYHGGDLNDWTWDGEPDAENRQMRGNYRHEIDKLKDRNIDIAFVPLDPRQDSHFADGMLYFLSKVNAKRVYPMHYWEQPEVIQRFLQAYPQYADVIVYPEPIAGGTAVCHSK